MFHASILDYFHVMTYDFHGSWEHNVGENSPLYKGPSDQGSMVYFNVVSEGFSLNITYITYCNMVITLHT